MRFLWSVYTFIGWPHSIPLNSFNISTMASSSILVTLYLHCAGESFWLKNTIGLLSWVITAPSCLLKSVCVNLKDFWKVRIGQNYFFSNSSFYMIECFLMELVPVPGYLFSSFCFWDFGLTTLSNQWGERGKHIALTCPEVVVILYHAKEVS